MAAPLPDPAEDALLLRQAVGEAGDLVRRALAGGFKCWDKKPGDPVTEIDLAVDRLLADRLLAARPGYGLLSEERPDDGAWRAAPRAWMLDPIDGTRALVKGKPEFAIAVGLVEGGRPIAGVVYEPTGGQLFEAVAGQGARLDGQPIRCGARAELAGARVLGSVSDLKRTEWDQALPEISLTRINSIALKLCLVAAGRYDAVVNLRATSFWDIAGADLICREAGCAVLDLWGRPVDYAAASIDFESLVVANPALQDRLAQRLRPVVERRRGRT